MSARAFETGLKKLGNRRIAEHSRRYFKTGPGEYGEGDRFLGIRVPAVRRFVRTNRPDCVEDIVRLLKSPWHEVRLAGLLAMVAMYAKADEHDRGLLYRAYLANTGRINNWDLVDLSAPQIVGGHLAERSRKPLYRLVRSRSLWERRIAVLATFWFIRDRDFADALKLGEILLNDKEDLIHKAVGWMLREIGKRDMKEEERFLRKHCRTMPRTMLRYAIEKMPESKRRAYMKGLSNDSSGWTRMTASGDGHGRRD